MTRCAGSADAVARHHGPPLRAALSRIPVGTREWSLHRSNKGVLGLPDTKPARKSTRRLIPQIYLSLDTCKCTSDSARDFLVAFLILLCHILKEQTAARSEATGASRQSTDEAGDEPAVDGRDRALDVALRPDRHRAAGSRRVAQVLGADAVRSGAEGEKDTAR
jgi:hypothetical protein